MEHEAIYHRFGKLVESVEGKLDPADDLYRALLVYFFHKGWKTVQSIFLLCKHGFGQDADILLRSLLELMINQQYISHDPSRRATLFCEYSYMEKKEFERVLRRFAQENPADTTVRRILATKPKDQAEEEEIEYRRVMNNYPNKNNWADLSMSRMASATKMSFQYILYKIFSRVTHPSSEGVNAYINADRDGLKCVNSPAEGTDRTIWTALMYFSRVLAEVDKTFELKLDTEISKLDHELAFCVKGLAAD